MTTTVTAPTPTHINLGKEFPATYNALMELHTQADSAASSVGLDPLLVELVKVRVSQLNGCAFCLRMHTRDAIAKGESTDRLSVVAAWWESQYFTPEEVAALEIAEQVTRVGKAHWAAAPAAFVSAESGTTGDEAVLSHAQRAAIGWLAVVMNAWNRVAITSHYRVAP